MKTTSQETEIHPLLSDRTRLLILAKLAAERMPVEFLLLQEALELSKGNLSSHLSKLEAAGLVEIIKDYVGKKPRTQCSVTKAGRDSVKRYLKQMETLLKALS